MLAQTMLPLSACQAKFGTENAKDGNGVDHILQFNFTNPDNSMICAARIGVPTASACNGGPLIVPGADASKDYQVGIVSWGAEGCANAINVYTDVGMIFDWIQDTVFRWTGDRLHPWTPPPFRPVTGTVLADNTGTGFDGKPVTYTGAKGAPLDIISSVPTKGVGWYLNGILTDGSSPGSRALGYVAWSYGATLAAQASPNGRLAVTLNNTPIRQGHAPDLGKLVTVRYPRDSCRRGWCADRLLEITVRPFITVTIIQPWISGATWGSRGTFVPWLQVKVTLLQKPGQQPTGVLGQTILV
ncbi:serine protease [Chlorella sorokiniana]|uniref:Serine protease n=1 Tax=Chlorella sorokiniana TaxID=3076 RepID=A0A2P6U3N5_CHLSO|nr:serine protease [Chlorella sorokiniana]|eukprot:PRW60928.1 serine protease [Chlorella sorokiniana]